MSRVYFHTPSAGTELRGSERAWLGAVAEGPARAAWRVDDHVDLDRIEEIIAMIPEEPDTGYGPDYLHKCLRDTKAEYGRPGGPRTFEMYQRLKQTLSTRLNGRMSANLTVGGHELSIADINLNTALAAGSPAVQLAAKINGWCESHLWIDGPDRAWLAGIIKDALDKGIYRRGLWYADQPDTPRDKWSDQGWGAIVDDLLSRDDEPVVLSYSVCDQFPNREAAGWEPPTLPDDWRPDWADGDGYNEWQEMLADEQAGIRRSAERDAWYDLPDDERWRLALDGLKANSPWLQLTPESLGDQCFGVPLTVYDVLAQDRDERVAAAFAMVAT